MLKEKIALQVKAIAFSLYGDSPKYDIGMIRNVELARTFYPDWKVVIFCPFWPRYEIAKALDSAKIVLCDTNRHIPFMMLRFLIADDPEVERFIVRDADSRLSPQEAAAVKEWEQEDTILHSCRSHWAHCRPINGGMWGAVWRRPNWEAPKMGDLIQTYLEKFAPTYKGHDMDQHFLEKMVWPWARRSCTEHGVRFNGFPRAKPFPLPWPEGQFMGQVVEVDADGNETLRKD